MKLSAHFDSSEFTCHHCGRRVGPPAELLEVLERLRAAVGRPLRVVSGYRCPVHNRAVHGATASRHLTGDACDLELGYATVRQARAAGAVGIGYRGVWATHVDTRPGPSIRFRD